MRYIKDIFALFVIAGVCGLVIAAGMADFIILGVSVITIVASSIGVCIAESVWEERERVKLTK